MLDVSTDAVISRRIAGGLAIGQSCFDASTSPSVWKTEFATEIELVSNLDEIKGVEAIQLNFYYQ